MKYCFFYITILATIFSCGNPTSQEQKKDGNELVGESSPYLLQHAYNPVDWHPWGEKALTKAKEEKKLILVSIGYAACHWCHVMEHESFEDTSIARIMNESFVNIKVDREERPDVDDIYMTACQMANGRGCGWPLNCFALPDGRPVWAGTYFPKEDWSQILDYFSNLYQEDPAKLEDYAKQLTQGIQELDIISVSEDDFQPDAESLNKMTADYEERMDPILGGKLGAPKFPMPNGIQYLLRAEYYQPESSAGELALNTLDKMARGGIYDHLGGGFARYSVDSLWLVPHFEKMLYDNGQLLSSYSEAYKLTQNEFYASVIDETIDWMQRELQHPDGGFYSSLDADSEGEEGKFYVWNYSEIQEAISDPLHFKWFVEYYGIQEQGNWEHGKNILHITKDLSSIQGYEAGVTEKAIEDVKKSLLEDREKRVRPGLDDKVLCSWNALALNGLIDAFEATQKKEYLEAALKNAQFLTQTFIKEDYRVDRNFKDGKTAINGFLDDYVLLADALINLYQITFDENWLNHAGSLIDYANEHFYDSESGFYFYTSDIDPELIARKKELADNVIPGSNSVMARVLWKLGILTDNAEFQERASRMTAATYDASLSKGQVSFYANWAILYSEILNRPYEIAILGPEAVNKCHALVQSFRPDALYLGGTTEGSLTLLENKLQEDVTYIYVCQNRVCKFPVEDVAEAQKLMN